MTYVGVEISVRPGSPSISAVLLQEVSVVTLKLGLLLLMYFDWVTMEDLPPSPTCLRYLAAWTLFAPFDTHLYSRYPNQGRYQKLPSSIDKMIPIN